MWAVTPGQRHSHRQHGHSQPRMCTVLHISTTANIGGAGRSAFRIHTGLKRLGVTSRMVVARNSVSDSSVGSVAPGVFRTLVAFPGLPVVPLAAVQTLAPHGRCGSAIQHGRVPRAHRAAAYRARPPDSLEALGHVAAHRPLQLLLRLRPLAYRLWGMSKSIRTAGAEV